MMRQRSPCFRHEQRLVEQGAFVVNLQLHLITFKRLSGATALSDFIGVIVVPSIFQPQSFGFIGTT